MSDPTNTTSADAGGGTIVREPPRFSEALRFWIRLGFVSFGGPTGQIAIMHAELVERKRWISDRRFLHALNYCMLLPGPEAQQLATYCGWMLHRTWGGIAAGSLFILPGVFILWCLSFIYVTHGDQPWVGAAFHGVKPAVMAIVAAATLRLGMKALRHPVMWGIAGAAFLAIFALDVPFPAIIASAALIGWVGSRLRPDIFAGGGHGPSAQARAVIDDEHEAPDHARAGWGRAIRVTGVCLTLWWAPVFAVGWWHGWDGSLFKQGIFFSKAAMVTFGGAYAVLPYVAQEAVSTHGWLTAPEMLDGLAFAESTPGPLIMVVQHVGFLGAWNQPGALPPLLAATLGAGVTTWVTFLPCFLWIFLGAPYIERMRGQARFNAALSAVTAAVVGVVLNLAVWFGWHVVRPVPGGTDWWALGAAVAGFIAIQRYKVGIIPIVAAGAVLGLVWHGLGVGY